MADDWHAQLQTLFRSSESRVLDPYSWSSAAERPEAERPEAERPEAERPEAVKKVRPARTPREREVNAIRECQKELRKVMDKWLDGVAIPECLIRLSVERDLTNPIIAHRLAYGIGTIRWEADELYTPPPEATRPQWTRWMKLRSKVSTLIRSIERSQSAIEAIDGRR